MKKILTIFCLGLAACLTGCNDDSDETIIYGTVPFTLTAELPERLGTAEEGSLLQGSWEQGAQLAMLKLNTTGVDKSVMTLTSSDTFMGTASTGIEDGNNIGVFYPATAYTATSSDTLTQVLSMSGQGGTLAGVAAYDFIYGTGKAEMAELSGSATMEMEYLTHIAKFKFTTVEGAPMPAISSMVVTALTDSICAGGTFDMKSGKFSKLYGGSITLANPTGMSATVYIAFLPGKAKLHFTLVTLDDEVYEAVTDEEMELKAGTIADTRTLICTPLPKAKVGDYYYSDATYSTLKDENKTCVGIVYALNDKNGNIDTRLTSSPYGRIVALDDAKRYVKWTINAEDMDAIKNYTFVQGTQTIACLPYYDGTVGSYSSEDSEEWVNGLSIDTATGAVVTWLSQGVLSDFNGKANTGELTAGTHTYPAGSYCYQYSYGGRGKGEWYLPAAGELALLWTLQRTGIIGEDKHEEFVNFRDVAYWSSSELSDSKAWYIHFLNGMIVANAKSSTYYVRAVSAF